MFHEFKVLGEERESAEVVAGLLRKILVELGPQNFFLLIPDNANVMKAALQILVTEFSHITDVGCASHSWDLLLKDLMKLPILNRLFLLAKAIVKSTKYKCVNLAVFRGKQKEKYGNSAVNLKLPAKTRWGGAVIMFN